MSTWIGLDLGGTKLAGLAVNDEGRVLARYRRATDPEDGSEAVFERCVAAVRDLERNAGTCDGVGLGFPGLVNPLAGCVLSSVIIRVSTAARWPSASRAPPAGPSRSTTTRRSRASASSRRWASRRG